ncbi:MULTISPECIES: methyltransferase domain-containing protein [Sphingobacterium]|uniref:methyltransferase domain-containing protein n=1 Tax=Sphingobacterium TaxID=28453 RepID=UPI0013DBE864|nr:MULTISPECIES: methyltransferase domain-containing protein [unclassified Sphingobacterium]
MEEQLIELDAFYWERRWKDKQTRWDIGYASPAIVRYAENYSNKDAAILIPGCGNAYEAAWLMDHGFNNVTVLDISPTAIANAQQVIKSDVRLQFVCADFFTYQGQFDLILEQTFFCAIPVSRRQEYTAKMTSLLHEKGRLVGVLFDREFEDQGPPFGGSLLEYQSLFADNFDFDRFECCYNSIPARAGTELFINLIKR